MPRIGNMIIGFGADVKGILSGIQQIEGAIGKFSRNFGSLGRGIAGTFAASTIVEFGRQALIASAKYETAFLKIKNLTDTNTSDLNTYQSKVKDISNKIGVSSLDLAQGLYSITSAGATGKVALETLEIAAKGAALGMGEANDIAKALTGTINAYGPANLSASRAAEILFKTTKQGAIDINELTGSLANVTPLASQMGVSLEEVGAFLATVSLNGTSASEGVTQLRSVLDAIINPSDQASKILAKMGLSIDDIQKTIREKGLKAALTQLQEGFNGNTTAISQFFGRKEATIGFLSALGTNSARYGEILLENSKLTNEFGRATDEALKSTENQWKQFVARFDNDLLGIGTGLKNFILKLNEAIGTFDNKVKKLGQFIDLDRRLFGIERKVKPLGAEAATAYLTGFRDTIAKSAGAYTQIIGINDKSSGTKPPPPPPDDKPLKEQITILSQLNTQREKLLDTIDRSALANKSYTSVVEKLKDVERQILLIEQARANALKDIQRNIGIVAQVDNKPKELSQKDRGIGSQVDSLNKTFEDFKPTEKISQFKRDLEDVKSTLIGIGEASTIAFSNIVADLLTGGLAFKDLGKAALEAGRQIVKAALAEALAGVIAKSISKLGILGLGIAVGGIALISSLFKSKVPKLAKGGISPFAHLAVVGDNYNARLDPEITTPTSHMRKVVAAEVAKLGKALASAFDQGIKKLDLSSLNTPKLNIDTTIASSIDKEIRRLDRGNTNAQILKNLSDSLGSGISKINNSIRTSGNIGSDLASAFTQGIGKISSANNVSAINTGNIGTAIASALSRGIGSIEFASARIPSIKIEAPSLVDFTRLVPDILNTGTLDYQPVPVDVNVTGRIAGNDIQLLNDRLTANTNLIKGRKYNY